MSEAMSLTLGFFFLKKNRFSFNGATSYRGATVYHLLWRLGLGFSSFPIGSP